MSTQDQIKAHVRERYGARARRAGETPAPTHLGRDMALDATPGIYTETELRDLPIPTIVASAGCGNPTALAGLKPGETVLDLGSGGGIDCFIAARQVGVTGKVIGLDMTPDMVALARKNAAKLGLTNVEFIPGEIERIPLPDATVDVVISNCVVNLSPDKDAVFRDMFRVLRPGGRVHISDTMVVGEIPDSARKDMESWAACASGADDRGAYAERLNRAGFREILITEESMLCGEGTSCASSAEDQAWRVVSVKVEAVRPG